MLSSLLSRQKDSRYRYGPQMLLPPRLIQADIVLEYCRSKQNIKQIPSLPAPDGDWPPPLLLLLSPRRGRLPASGHSPDPKALVPQLQL